MSLREAYHLAHTAQCRLNIEASRPDRNLRFVVGHLMHYESLRLRIVEIEHDIHEDRRAKAAHIDHTLQYKPSTAQPVQPSSSASTSQQTYLDEFPETDDYDDLDEDTGDDLSLSRFPSAASKPQPPPDLESDDSSDDDYDEDFLIDYSAGSPAHDALQHAVKGKENELVASMYESVRRCSCHDEDDAPTFERMWDFPDDDHQGRSKEGVTRAVGQVTDHRTPSPAASEMVKAIPVTAVA